MTMTHIVFIIACVLLGLLAVVAGLLWIAGAVATDEEWHLDEAERRDGLRDNE